MTEKDPSGKDPKAEGAKLDFGKTPVYQGLLDYFPRACEAVAVVSAVGASKYSWKGWETVPDGYNRYSDAMLRHITKRSQGELYDDGPGGLGDYTGELKKHLHDAQVAWNALARLEIFLREQETNS